MQCNLLSLDGGGVRGIMTAVVLEELDNLTKKPLIDYFQYQIASSTGSLIQGASNLTTQNFTYTDLVKLYKTKAKTIFHRTFWDKIENPKGLFSAEFPDTGIDHLLKEDFGKTALTDLKCKNIYFTSFDFKNREYVTFNNHNMPKMLLHETVRACTAAPTYFKPLDNYTDGGLGANNPSSLGLSYLVNDGVSLSKTCVVSIGTGKVKTGINIGNSGVLKVASKLPALFMGASMGATDLMMKNFLGKNYHRIEFSISEDEDKMDNTNEENLETLEKIAEIYIDDHQIELIKLAKKLDQS